MPHILFRLARWCGPLAALATVLWPMAAGAGTLLVCRDFDMANPPTQKLVVPEASVFRDNGRLDDPLASFGNDRRQLRLETVSDVVIPGLQACARVLVRITSDSSVKTVSASENRGFVYAGSNLLIDRPEASEEILTLKARVLDAVQ